MPGVTSSLFQWQDRHREPDAPSVICRLSLAPSFATASFELARQKFGDINKQKKA